MGYTYDLQKLHAQVRDLLPADARFCIDFEIWDGGALGLTSECRIYHEGQHYTGATPDEALAKLRHELRGPVLLQPDDLGIVAVPERQSRNERSIHA